MGRYSLELRQKQQEERRQKAKEVADAYKKEQRKKRKAFTKKERQAVYDKYQGHCAYCGKEIAMGDMQIDHIIPIANSIYGKKEQAEKVRQMCEDGSIHAIDNLMPACRKCNFYKSINSIESFRERIKNELSRTCQQSFQTKLAMQYGMITFIPWDGRFYFEKVSG